MSAGGDAPCVLVLTPVKNAARHLDRHFDLLSRLTFPHDRLSLGFLDSDSDDGTFEALESRLPGLRSRYARVGLWKRDFGFRIPEQYARWAEPYQIPRRIVLAKSRNYLLARALDDEHWVLWVDVDLAEYPPDVIDRLLAAGKDIVQPHCLRRVGPATFDYNPWRDHGRLHMWDLREEGDLVRLDAVGGTMLLVKADAHREGLIFPPFLYGRASRVVRDPNPWQTAGELETEGLGVMAQDMGYQCWGMPNLEIRHAGR